jgi:hypothetical protein
VEASQPQAPRLPAALIGLPLAALVLLVGMVLCLAVLSSGSAAGCGGAGGVGSVRGVPPRLAPIYEQAAARYGLGPKGPSILAAINKVETDFGTNLKVSSAGAQGWMQFMPSTWETYGVDANGDGRTDPNDPWDAIFAAANYLHASGAPGDWHGAILSYNHAEWYVAEVLTDAERYGGGNSALASTELASCEVAAPNERVARMIAEADRLSALRPHSEYVWGGSHGSSPTPPNGPFDCSSAVSHLLQVGGFHNPTMDTIALSAWGSPGPGRWITIHVKPYEPEAHTIIEFMPGATPPSKRYWGTSGLFSGHGPGWLKQSDLDATYLSRFQLRHPLGF